MAPHASAARSTPAARCGLRRCGCASRRPHGSVLRTLLRCYPGVSVPGLVGRAGVAPASAGFLCPRAQAFRPMCPSVRAAKRLFGPRSRLRRPVGFGAAEPLRGCPHPSVLRTLAFRFATHIGGSQFNGTDNRRVDQTRRWWGGRASNPHLHSLAQPRACECRSFPDELPSHIGPQRASASVTRWPSSRPPPSPSPPRGRTSPE